jgi:hypothetical protein
MELISGQGVRGLPEATAKQIEEGEQEERDHAGAGTAAEYHCVHCDLFYNARTLHAHYSKVAFNQKDRFSQVRRRGSLVYILIGLACGVELQMAGARLFGLGTFGQNGSQLFRQQTRLRQ